MGLTMQNDKAYIYIFLQDFDVRIVQFHHIFNIENLVNLVHGLWRLFSMNKLDVEMENLQTTGFGDDFWYFFQPAKWGSLDLSELLPPSVRARQVC